MTAVLSSLEEAVLGAAYQDAEPVWKDHENVDEFLKVFARSYVQKCVCCGLLPVSELPSLELKHLRRVGMH